MRPCARNWSSFWKKTVFTVRFSNGIQLTGGLQDAEREVLAEKGKPLGQLLEDVITLVQPEALLKWHPRLVALFRAPISRDRILCHP